MQTEELAALIALLRANGVTKYSTPQLTLELAPFVPESVAPAACPVPRQLPAEVERALAALPPQYRSGSLWDLGDRA